MLGVGFDDLVLWITEDAYARGGAGRLARSRRKPRAKAPAKAAAPARRRRPAPRRRRSCAPPGRRPLARLALIGAAGVLVAGARRRRWPPATAASALAAGVGAGIDRRFGRRRLPAAAPSTSRAPRRGRPGRHPHGRRRSSTDQPILGLDLDAAAPAGRAGRLGQGGPRRAPAARHPGDRRRSSAASWPSGSTTAAPWSSTTTAA